MIPLNAYVAVSAVLFITGLLGVVIRRNFIIAIAAGEAAIGLAIIIVVFRGKISTNVDEMNLLKW